MTARGTRVAATVVAALACACVCAGERVTSMSVRSFSPGRWVTAGDAMMSSELVRLVPDRQSRRGGFWNTDPILFRDWSVQFDLRIHGQGSLGADGLAFWYAREHSQLGPLFGQADPFQGIGVIVDTYDNANTGTHPYVFALHNDGSHKYGFGDHDHTDHLGSVPLGSDAAAVNGEIRGCTAKLRNWREPSSLRIVYRGSALTVSYRYQPSDAWAECFTVPRITLPTGYYVGFSAATGDLADDHDVSNITIVDLADTPFSTPIGSAATYALPPPAQPSQQGASISGLQQKLDGVVDLVKDTIRTLGANKNTHAAGGAAVADLQPTIDMLRTLQSQVSQVSGQTAETQNLARQILDGLAQRDRAAERLPIQKRGGWGFFSWLVLLVLLGLSGTTVYFYVQLHSERRTKKFF